MTIAILCVLWVLWPLVALAGGLAFAPLCGLAALLLAPLFLMRAPREFRVRLYMPPLLAFFVFAAVSVFWSPRPLAIVEFDFAHWQFSVRSEVARVGLLFLALGVLIACTGRLGLSSRRLVQRFALGALLVQVAIIGALTIFERQLLVLLSPLMSNSGEGVQNLSRNALLAAAAVPSIALLVWRGGAHWRGWLLVLAVVGVNVAVLVYRDVQGGLLSLAASAGCMAIVWAARRWGFRIIGVLLALFILSAPLVFGVLSSGARAEDATTSAEWRLAIWAKACGVIQEHPFIGAGVGALRTMREFIPTGVFAGQLYMPNHPHNMLLQLWAETGAVGVTLLAAAIVAVAWRLPAPERLGRSAYNVAALVGAFTAGAAVSFDLWNEWWWAAAGLLATLAVRSLPADHAATEGASIEEGDQAKEPLDQLTWLHGRENNFHLVRLVLALMVMAYHVVRLSGAWQQFLPPLEIAAQIGVQGFFVVSGYLVSSSLEQSASIAGYAEKRFRRLYPAYAVVILGCAVAALVVGPHSIASLGQIARYLGANLAFLNFLAPTLPGLFSGNPTPEVNGALWTLKIEVMFYVVLPILALLIAQAGERGRWLLMAAIYLGAEAWRNGAPSLRLNLSAELVDGLSRQLPGQMSFFIVGVGLYLIRELADWRIFLAVVGAVGVAASALAPELSFLWPLGLGCAVIWIAVGLPRLFDAARFGDLSYGLYILHFPVIQAAVALGLFRNPPIGAAVSLALSTVLALAMWWLVERPALRADSAYRRRAVA